MPPRLLRRLDSLVFWIIAAYFLLVVSLVVGAAAFWRASDARNNTAKAEAVAEAERLATRQRCLSSIPLLSRVNVYVAGVAVLADVLVANADALLAETPLDSPMLPVRAANLQRLIAAAEDIHSLGGFPVPTRQQCLRR